MTIAEYYLHVATWGVDQDGTGEDRDIQTTATLAATGSGVWATLDTHRTIRLGAFAFEGGVDHRFYVGLAETVIAAVNGIQFRIRDITNSLTIATATPPFGGGPTVLYYPFSDTFSNLPAGDALVELQYTLISPSTCKWFSAFWRVRKSNE
jgi:hypothetical protein